LECAPTVDRDFSERLAVEKILSHQTELMRGSAILNGHNMHR
jgi:hypothetical protein